ncbi:MAG: response regulator [Lachnospiraceae bacterium]|nr:response regulator [Lachnospiraceae bacterium]
MKSLLIVEDEKLIRQGIRTMVQRSGVPVEMILECPNGEVAWEILKEQHIDVMFTDIRMPKMDGIELVKKTRELTDPPLIVAVSGYDDFSYAVEMLRSGVREYILKPVERERIADVLGKLNSEIEGKNEIIEKDKDFGIKEIRQLFERPTLPEGREEEIADRYGKFFIEDSYRVFVCPAEDIRESEGVIVFNNVNGACVAVVSESIAAPFEAGELFGQSVGISDLHENLKELRTAYNEALLRRKVAFTCKKTIRSAEDIKNVPEALKEQALKLTDEASALQRLQLVGTRRADELDEQWGKLFAETERGNLEYDRFNEAIQDFADNVVKIYKNAITREAEEKLTALRNILSFGDLEEYRESLMGWIMELKENISISDDSAGKKKLQAAVEYVEKNYMKDLNMAVVSNYISMNYSMLSFLFKQYTGTNFVNYLKAIRIKEAKKLLTETDMKIIEISKAVGYDNEKHFMKTFKAECGVSPGEFRKNMQRT